MMPMLVNIFFTFVKISLFSFGGGYVAFPIISAANESYQWMSDIELANILSLAGMSPGPVAINAAVGVGYRVAGLSGVFAAFLGIALPCIVILMIAATFFYKVYKHPLVKQILYILRPLTTGIILYAALSFSMKNGFLFSHADNTVPGGWNITLSSITLFEVKSIFLVGLTCLLLSKTKIHPMVIILLSGASGILIF